MAQSFLNIPGLPLGLRNNNPGNLRPLPGGQKWVGEIAPDTVNNFSRFQNIAYGLRAMITDITGDIVIDQRNTIRKLIASYAPAMENNTQAYINAVSNYTDLDADQIINPTRATIEKLIKAQMNVELGPSNAARISQGDINEAFDLVTPQVRSWLNMPGADGLVTASLIGLFFYFIVKLARKGRK